MLFRSPHRGIAWVFAFCLLLAGCSSSPAVKDDYHAYLKQLASFAKEQNTVMRTNMEVFGNMPNFTTVTGKAPLPSTKDIRGKVLPNLKTYIAHLQTIHPTTPEVKDLHATTIASMQYLHDNYSLMAEGIEQRDQTKIDAYMKNMKQSVDTTLEMGKKGDRLKEQYGIPSDVQRTLDEAASQP
jgi:hypothetical protein